MRLIDYLISRHNKCVPACAIAIRKEKFGLSYHHPRKGWKKVCWMRLGMRPANAISHP